MSDFDWWEDAGCRGIGVEAFEFISPQVKRICAGCPVRDECLDSALEEEREFGFKTRFMIRGGMTPTQRYKLAVERGMTDPRRTREGREVAA